MIHELSKYRKYLILFIVFSPYIIFYKIAFTSSLDKLSFFEACIVYFFVFFMTLFLEAENAKWLSDYSRRTRVILCLGVTLFCVFLSSLAFI